MRISDWSSTCALPIYRANRENYQFPRQCPVCGSETERPVDEAVRRCTAGLSCSGQRLERLIHLASRDALNIDGFGSEAISEFLDAGIISEPAHIFQLHRKKTELVLRSGWGRSEEHTSELQSLMRISYAVFCLK